MPRPSCTSKTATKARRSSSTMSDERGDPTRAAPQRRESARSQARGDASPATPNRVIQRIDGARDRAGTPMRRRGARATPWRAGIAPADRDEADTDQRPRPVAPVAQRRRDDRVLLAVVGHHERRREIDQDPRPAEQGEDDEGDTEDCRVDLEVPAPGLQRHRRGRGPSGCGAELASVRRGGSSAMRDGIMRPGSHPGSTPRRRTPSSARARGAAATAARTAGTSSSRRAASSSPAAAPPARSSRR